MRPVRVDGLHGGSRLLRRRRSRVLADADHLPEARGGVGGEVRGIT